MCFSRRSYSLSREPNGFYFFNVYRTYFCVLSGARYLEPFNANMSSKIIFWKVEPETLTRKCIDIDISKFFKDNLLKTVSRNF